MTVTPHLVGQIEKARREIADILESTGAPAERVPTLAGRIVDALQGIGWTPPHDPNAGIPPLRPAQAADEHSPGRQAFRAGLCDRYGHQPENGRCRRCCVELADA